jgi:hypothetical protein
VHPALLLTALWEEEEGERKRSGRILRNNEVHIFHGAIDPNVPGPPHYRGFTITLSNTILGRTPLDE